MKLKLLTLTILTSLFLLNSLFATGITFTFANGQITGNSPKFYEFDVMAHADGTGTNIQDLGVYINYNTDAFGQSVVEKSKIIVTKGTLIEGDGFEGPGHPKYDIALNDNSSSRFAVTTIYKNALPTELPTGATQLIRVKLEIADETETSGITFQQSLMDGVQYYRDDTKYNPVTTSGGLDQSLPVELSVFSAKADAASITLNWVTQSEIDNVGFEIMRSREQSANFQLIASYRTHEELKGQGNATTATEYRFVDETATGGETYWYQLVDVDLNGKRTLHGPVSVTLPNLPDKFQLYQNYPNPFNPTTTIRFDVPNTPEGFADVQLLVYNTIGQRVKALYDEKAAPGSYQVNWDGTNNLGISVSAGLYFAVFKTKQFTKVMKLLFVK